MAMSSAWSGALPGAPQRTRSSPGNATPAASLLASPAFLQALRIVAIAPRPPSSPDGDGAQASRA
eukprot:7339198-Alexandrium_andersonii.AAC.1